MGRARTRSAQRAAGEGVHRVRSRCRVAALPRRLDRCGRSSTLPPISARGDVGGRGRRGDRGARRRRARAAIDDKIVRLIVRDVPRHVARELDQKALREYKRRALHFHLDPRRPDIARPIAHERRAGPSPVAHRDAWRLAREAAARVRRRSRRRSSSSACTTCRKPTRRSRPRADRVLDGAGA